MDKKTQGAWVIHHGKKVAGADRGAASYPAIDLAAKSGALLARMAATKQSELNRGLVETLAKAGGLSTRTDLPVCLEQLEVQRVIDRSKDGAVSVIGVTASSALDHTANMFDACEPEQQENAAIFLGEMVSNSPIGKKIASEQLGDEFKLAKNEVDDLMWQATSIGFIESDEDTDDPLLFNGNLFRRDSIAKTRKVLDSLSVEEQRAFHEFEDMLKRSGAVRLEKAEQMLGSVLLSKLRAAAVFDENIVSNENGDHSFVTSPGAFHKFTSPLIDDAFDHAKALVSALSYGMHVSSATRGQIWGVELLLKKMLRSEEVGPAPAIGKDYRALELERVVGIRQSGSRYFMKLLKMEVGQIALQVLKSGSAATSVLEGIPSAQVTSYTGPEKSRKQFRQRKELQPSNSQLRGLLSSVRSGGGL